MSARRLPCNIRKPTILSPAKPGDINFVDKVNENPKHIQAQKEDKAPMEYIIFSALEDDARGLRNGANKYGVGNWLVDPIKATTYVGAMMRHLKAWAEGEDEDLDDNLHPLTHLRNCCAIVLDAEKHGTLIDDRQRRESKGERT